MNKPDGVTVTYGDDGATIRLHGVPLATTLAGGVVWRVWDAPADVRDYVVHVQREQYRRILDLADMG